MIKGKQQRNEQPPRPAARIEKRPAPYRMEEGTNRKCD